MVTAFISGVVQYTAMLIFIGTFVVYQFVNHCQQHTTLHPTDTEQGWSLDWRPDAAGSGVGGPVGGTLSSGLKIMPQGSDWGHFPV